MSLPIRPNQSDIVKGFLADYMQARFDNGATTILYDDFIDTLVEDHGITLDTVARQSGFKDGRALLRSFKADIDSNGNIVVFEVVMFTGQIQELRPSMLVLVNGKKIFLPSLPVFHYNNAQNLGIQMGVVNRFNENVEKIVAEHDIERVNTALGRH